MNKKHKSEKALKREERRNSGANLSLKNQLINYLDKVTPDSLIAYSLKIDLKKMTDMPFYGEKILRPDGYKRIAAQEILTGYINFLLIVNDIIFSETLLKAVSRQQTQVLRRVSPRIGIKKNIWDHAIPTSFVVSELLVMLRNKNIDNLRTLIDLYVKAGQRPITKEEDELLNSNGLKNRMPPNWNWKNSEVDVFARYKISGIATEKWF
jgi:hypothetical protein